MEVLVTNLTRRIVEVGHGLPERPAASNVIRHFCKRPAAKDRGHMVKDSADESGGCEVKGSLIADIDLTQKIQEPRAIEGSRTPRGEMFNNSWVDIHTTRGRHPRSVSRLLEFS